MGAARTRRAEASVVEGGGVRPVEAGAGEGVGGCHLNVFAAGCELRVVHARRAPSKPPALSEDGDSAVRPANREHDEAESPNVKSPPLLQMMLQRRVTLESFPLVWSAGQRTRNDRARLEASARDVRMRRMRTKRAAAHTLIWRPWHSRVSFTGSRARRYRLWC